ncbi:MAG: Bax inhibitor-1/YccA family protein [Chloroflexi bacterium]|nr:Bax inhibitor-1/YccA family protein [Chloroflexota bacterium]
MNRFGTGTTQTNVVVDDNVARGFIVKVYGWMTLALVITGIVAIATAANPDFVAAIASTPAMIALVVGQLVLVVVLSAAIRKLSAGIATGLFIIYSALTGLTFSMLFLIYTGSSIAQVFFITAGTFGLVSAYGYVTKRDLTSIGNLLFMALIGLIVASIVNIFLNSAVFDWILTFVGIVIFVGLIAYDTQRIKRMSAGLDENGETYQKAAVFGALALYLDFINLFIRLLRIFGRQR